MKTKEMKGMKLERLRALRHADALRKLQTAHYSSSIDWKTEKNRK